MSEKSEILESFYKNLNWETYVKVTDLITKVDPLNIDQELKMQPAFYSHYAGLLALAKQDLSILEAEFDRKKGQLRTSIAKGHVGDKKLTDKALEALVEGDDSVLEARKGIFTQESKYNLLKSLVTSLDHKRDVLVQLSSNHRAEAKLYSKG